MQKVAIGVIGVVGACAMLFAFTATRGTLGDVDRDETVVGLGDPADPALLVLDPSVQDRAVDPADSRAENAQTPTSGFATDPISPGFPGEQVPTSLDPTPSTSEPGQSTHSQSASDPRTPPPGEVTPIPTTPTPTDPFETAVARLPGGLRNLLTVASVTFGCHPEEGCHYGVWDYRTNTVWLSPNLLGDPELLYSVLSHELAHVADTHLYSDQLRGELYGQVPSSLNPGEALADCVTLASGGSWTYYWDCPSSGLRSQLAAIFSP